MGLEFFSNAIKKEYFYTVIDHLLVAKAFNTIGDIVNAPPKSKKYSILVLNNEPRLLELIRILLVRENYKVIVKANIVEAIQYVKTHNSIALTISYHCEDMIQGSDFLRQIAILSPNTVRYMTNCCLPQQILKQLIADNTIQLHSKIPFSVHEVTKNVALGLQLYEKNIAK
jgi:response regulator RpfG family c-di-GMP phosphodiesterase